MKTTKTDVLVIGSGFGGAAPALRLAEAGFSVTMIEKGPAIDPYRDFRQTQDPKYLLKYIKGMAGDNMGLTYAEALGGGSGFYEMVSLRAPTMAFEQRDANGRGLWPSNLSRNALDPYYDRSETMLNIEQIQPELVPKSGQVFAQMFNALGYSCERARYAVRGCMASGYCVTGCIYGAKQSLLVTYLPRAVEAGLHIETGLAAEEIRPLRARRADGAMAGVPDRYEVWCRDEDGGRRNFRTKLLILAGGTVGTAKLLLRSGNSLPGLSSHVGKHIAFNGGVKTAGLLGPGFPDGDMFAGRSHPGMISYEFLASHGITIAAAKPLPLQAVASARMRLDGDGRDPAHWGEAHVDLMKRFRRRVMVLFALGLTPPGGRLERVGRNDFDLKLDLTDELVAYHRRTKKLLGDIFRRAGCRVIVPTFVDQEGAALEEIFYSSAHHVGSCRMSDNIDAGVCNVAGEIFGYPGMYVSDGAAIPSSLAVNTSLTILANAERIADGICARYQPGREAVVASARH